MQTLLWGERVTVRGGEALACAGNALSENDESPMFTANALDKRGV